MHITDYEATIRVTCNEKTETVVHILKLGRKVGGVDLADLMKILAEDYRKQMGTIAYSPETEKYLGEIETLKKRLENSDKLADELKAQLAEAKKPAPKPEPKPTPKPRARKPAKA